MLSEFHFPLAQGGGFDWEGVVPIVIFIFYALSQFLGSGTKKKAKEKKREATRRRQGPAGESPSEAAEEARAREIREEIQRRIAEKQQQGQPTAQPPVMRESEAPRYDPTVPEPNQRRARRRDVGSSPVPVEEARKAAEVARAPEPAAAPARRAAWADRGNGSSIEERLRQQKKRLELARSERDSALKKAREITARSTRQQSKEKQFSWAVADRSPARLRSDVIEALSDPAGAQKAMLYLEILGPPLAYRDPEAASSRIP